MSNDEWKELSEKLHYGLALAEQRMLEKKAQRNETVIVGEKTTSTADGFSTLALLIVISVCCAAHTEGGVLNRPPRTHRDKTE